MSDFVVREQGYEIHVEHPLVRISLREAYHKVAGIEITLPEPEHLRKQFLKNNEEIDRVEFVTGQIGATWVPPRSLDWDEWFNFEDFVQKAEDYARALIEDTCRKLAGLLKEHNLEHTTIILSDFRRNDSLRTEKKGRSTTYIYTVYYRGELSFDPPLTHLVGKKFVLTNLEKELTSVIPTEVTKFMSKYLENARFNTSVSFPIISNYEKIWWKISSGATIFYRRPLLWKFKVDFFNHDMYQIRSLFKDSLTGVNNVFDFIRKLLAVISLLNVPIQFFPYLKGDWDTPRRTGHSSTVLLQIIDELEGMSVSVGDGKSSQV